MTPNHVITMPEGSLRATLRIEWPRDWPRDWPVEDLPTNLVGPICEYSSTLSARWKLTTHETDSAIAQSVVVNDPCYWSSELPFLYELRNASDQLIAVVGLRDWRADKSTLRCEGRVTVLRGARCDAGLIEMDDWPTLRDQKLTLVVEDPSIDFCWQAARLGMPLVVMVEESQSSLDHDYVQRLAACPAVLVVMLGIDCLPLAAKPLAPGPLYGMTICDEVIPPSDWAQVAGVVLEEFRLADLIDKPPPFPLLVFGYANDCDTWEEARRECEQLQAECAPWTGLSGYFLV